MQLTRALQQYRLGFRIRGIRDTAIDRAYRRAGFMIVKPYAFSTFRWNDVIDVLCDSGTRYTVEVPLDTAAVDGSIRALRLARAAVDALARNFGGHSWPL